MLNGRTWIYVALIALLTGAVGDRLVCAADKDAATSWHGEDVGRMSVINQEQFATSLRTFFGQSTGAMVPNVGPLLYDQFSEIGMPDQYRLPDGRLIVDASDGRAGIDAVAVIPNMNPMRVLATAFLTHLCPKAGVDENFASSSGMYKQHFTCELDYSLIIMYAHGTLPDPDLNLDLIRWAKASVDARRQFVVPSDRKLLLKRFVRVLNDRPLDLTAADDTFPLQISLFDPFATTP